MGKRMLMVALVCLGCSWAHADEIILTSGQKIEGKILEQNNKSVKIDAGEGISADYYMDEITSINDHPVDHTEAASQSAHQAAAKEPTLSTANPAPATVPDNTAMATPPQPVETAPQPAPVPEPVVAAPAYQPVTQQTVSSTIVVDTVVSKKPVSSITVTSYPMPKRHQASPQEALGALRFIAIFLFLIYILFVIPLQILATKTRTPNAWLAWVPLVNLYLLCKVAGKPGWWALLCFIPLVSIIVSVLLWMAIATVRNKPRWLGVLIVVPLINFIVIWYLALTD